MDLARLIRICGMKETGQSTVLRGKAAPEVIPRPFADEKSLLAHNLKALALERVATCPMDGGVRSYLN